MTIHRPIVLVSFEGRITIGQHDYAVSTNYASAVLYQLKAECNYSVSMNVALSYVDCDIECSNCALGKADLNYTLKAQKEEELTNCCDPER
jgi:hypothetical protein